MNNVFIILVKPQLGQNIGSVARVMKNLNFKNLRIVNPRDGWPNQDVISTAAGADDVITNTKVFDNVSEACNDLNYLLLYIKINSQQPLLFLEYNEKAGSEPLVLESFLNLDIPNSYLEV